MKKYLMKGASALVLGGFLAGCTHDEIDISTYVAEKVKAYEQVFVNEFGTINPEQDWGFGRVASVRTRGAATWDGVHTCYEANWEDKLNFSLPANAVQLDTQDNMYTNWQGKETCRIPSDATAIYVSKDFNGEFVFDGNISGGVSFYNYGTITGFSGGNFTGTTTIYNAGTMTYNVGQQDHNIVNTGTLKVEDNDAYSKILNLYNGGYIEFSGGHTDWSTGQAVFVGGEPAQLHSKSTIYSKGKGINMPYGGVIESTCDIHETVTVTGNLNIQTGTKKYICGIVASGRIQNTAGELVTSYMEADDIYFEGNELKLLPGSHVKANTIEFDKAACDIHAAAGSNALVEATVNISFKNDNDFNRTFSDNIYFKVDGSIDMRGQTNGGFTDADRILYNSADDYITKHGNPNNHLNAGNATGYPECGPESSWTVGGGSNEDNPGEDGPGEDGEIQIPTDDPTISITTMNYYKETQLIEQGRVFCEDLGQISSNDLDFNDVVFDAYIYKVDYVTEMLEDGVVMSTWTTKTEYDYEVTLWAAGGTLSLQVVDREVNNAFGGKEISVIINTVTSADEAYGNVWAECKPVTLTGTADYKAIVEIPIIIKYSNGTVLTLDASQGEAPHKICVPIGTKWAKERQKIDEAYLDFQKYVNSKTEFWNGPKDESKLYSHPQDNATERSTEITRVLIGTEDSGSLSGGYNGTEVLARPRK